MCAIERERERERRLLADTSELLRDRWYIYIYGDDDDNNNSVGVFNNPTDRLEFIC